MGQYLLLKLASPSVMGSDSDPSRRLSAKTLEAGSVKENGTSSP